MDELDGLRKCQARLGSVLAYRHLLGGKEVTAALDLDRRIRQRLDVEPIEKLESEASAFIEANLAQIEVARAGFARGESDKEYASVQHLKLRGEREAKVRDAIQEAERRRMAEIVNSQIG